MANCFRDMYFPNSFLIVHEIRPGYGFRNPAHFEKPKPQCKEVSFEITTAVDKRNDALVVERFAE